MQVLVLGKKPSAHINRVAPLRNNVVVGLAQLYDSNVRARNLKACHQITLASSNASAACSNRTPGGVCRRRET